MTPKEIEQAISVSPKEYPPDLPCAVCRFRWMQHKGTLCPRTPGYFDRFLMQAFPPTFADTTFIPDLAYLNQNPDFDVV